MGLLSQKIKREELKVGDHIYSWRYAYVYAHHGCFLSLVFFNIYFICAAFALFVYILIRT
ncbi:hypothetical protein WN943_004513 [Citrus x changshan-huyou]